MSESDQRYTPAEVNPEGADQTNPYGPPGGQPSAPPPPPPSGGDSSEYTAPPPSTSGAPQTGADLTSRQQFINLDLSSVKEMVQGADPSHVKTVGENWTELHDDLVGEDGAGGLKKKFDDAVQKVLKTWHGKSADQFAKAAQKISKDFADVSYRPAAVGMLLDQVADRLQEVMGFVESVKEPSDWERAKDRGADLLGSGPMGAASVLSPALAVTNLALGEGRDDSGLNRDLADPNISIAQAVNNNAGTLSIDRERQLEAAHYVDQLASVYRSAKDEIDKTQEGKPPETPSGPGGPGGNGPGGSMPSISPFKPGGGGPGAGPGADMPTADIPGYEGQNPGTGPGAGDLDGIGGPKPGSDVGTGLEGVGTGAGGAGSGAGNLGGVSGAGGIGSGAGSGGGSGGGVGAAGGLPGGMAGAGGGGARGTGRMGGMPGMGGGAGAGAGGKGGGGRGGLAKKRGGAVGTPGRGGAAAQGGSGLHRSRGGSQAGKGVGRGTGMMGAPGARGAGGGDKNRSQRPDYLVEDEESWTPKKNVAPRVIE